MQVESLDDLKRAFDMWRRKKRYAREAVPADLLERARAAAQRHGPAAVHRATKVDRSRLKVGHRSRGGMRAPAVLEPLPVAAFSRVELAAPAVAVRPFAEVETTAGLKLRLFTPTDQVLGLLSSLCGLGGGR
jgi:hypothetical protein